jgi:hypothetical protein
MTAPHTLSIDQTEWRVLFASNIQRVTEFVGQTTTLTPENLIHLLEHLDRAKLLASAWQKSAPAKEPEVLAADVPAKSNGAEVVKKRGRPRKMQEAAGPRMGVVQ